MRNEQPSEFEKAAASEEPQQPFLVELWGYLKTNKKWWMLPILVAMLTLGALIALGGTAIAPFLYTLF